MSENLDTLRNKIKEIDKKLVELLLERIKVVQQIGQIKIEKKMHIIDKEREQEVISYVLSIPHDSIDSEVLENIFWQIIKVCRETQQKQLPKT